MGEITVQARHMTDLERKVRDLFTANGVNPDCIASDSVRIEFREGFGAVLVGETFIPVDAEDFAG